MNAIKKIAVLVMIASMALSCFVFASSAEAQKEYVTNGLVAWYDASNNSNGSFSNHATVWKDLTGNGNHIDVSDELTSNHISWKDGKLVVNSETGCSLNMPSDFVSALMGDAYTVEIVTGDLNYTATAYITLLSSKNDEFSIFVRCGANDNMKFEYKNWDANGDDNRPYVYNCWDHIKSKTLTIASDLHNFDGTLDMKQNPNQTGNVHVYSDGTMIAKGESKDFMILDKVTLGSTAPERKWGGEIYAIRIYERALTEAEVKANAEADVFNYRSGKTIEPTQKYDPALDDPNGAPPTTTVPAPVTTVPSTAATTTKPATKPSDKKTGGCSSSVAGLGATVAMIMLGSALALKKKK